MGWRIYVVALVTLCDGLQPPSVGTVTTATRKLHVIGTVHTPSPTQQAEVAALIESICPDVVLVELDQPRLEALLARKQQSELAFGAELAEALQTAEACGIPVVLGDAILPIDALWQARPFVDGSRLWRAVQRTRFAPGVFLQRVDVGRTLAADPFKAAPLATAMVLTLALLALSSAAAPPTASPTASGLVLAALSVCALLRFVDVLLLARDEVLCENALRALEIGEALQSGRLIRHQFTFSTRASTLAECNGAMLHPSTASARGLSQGELLPFLTLRSPLLEGEVRQVCRAGLPWSVHALERTCMIRVHARYLPWSVQA